MTNNKKMRWTLLISLTIIVSFSIGSINASAHDPRYIDLKYYDEEHLLSVYVTHGVSDSEYHYVAKITVEYYELPEWLINEFLTNEKYILVAIDPADQPAEEAIFGKYAIQEADVFDVVDDNTLNKTLIIEDNHTNQVEDLINHYTYDLDIPEWTLIVITAFCSLGGAFTHSLISGHPWYDIEHHISEAILPTIVCAIIVMIPLVILRGASLVRSISCRIL